jgi:hypothetical protein
MSPKVTWKCSKINGSGCWGCTDVKSSEALKFRSSDARSSTVGVSCWMMGSRELLIHPTSRVR